MPVFGLEEIMQQLQELPEAIMDGAEAGMRKGMQRIEGDAKENAPVDTGELRQKIERNVYRGFGGLEGHVKAYAEHAPYVEFGTGAVGQASGGRGKAYKTKGWTYFDGKRFVHTKGQPARPFLFPAFMKNQKKVIADIAAGIRRRLGQ